MLNLPFLPQDLKAKDKRSTLPRPKIPPQRLTKELKLQEMSGYAIYGFMEYDMINGVWYVHCGGSRVIYDFIVFAMD